MMLKTNTILRFCFVIGSLLWGLTACAGGSGSPAPTLAPTPAGREISMLPPPRFNVAAPSGSPAYSMLQTPVYNRPWP